jgi:hypothetical protein
MIGEQKNQTEGTVTLSVKIPTWMADQLNAIAKTRGNDVNANHLLALCLQFICESAKHSGPIAPEFQVLLNMLKLDASWNNAFNFGSTAAQQDIAQVILVLQQHDGKQPRKGFGLMMIDKPFMGEATYTTCVDDILERVAEVSMRGLYKMLRQIGVELDSQSLRETLTMMCDAQTIVNLEEADSQELPGYDNYHDFGRKIELGKKYKRVRHRTPDSLANSQQKIHFDDFDRNIDNDEADGGEHIGEHVSPEEIEETLGCKPFDVEP